MEGYTVYMGLLLEPIYCFGNPQSIIGKKNALLMRDKIPKKSLYGGDKMVVTRQLLLDTLDTKDLCATTSVGSHDFSKCEGCS